MVHNEISSNIGIIHAITIISHVDIHLIELYLEMHKLSGMLIKLTYNVGAEFCYQNDKLNL